jgi:hypothetical protein
MAISALDSTSTSRQLKTTEVGGEHIPHHRDSFLEDLIGPKIQASLLLSPDAEGSLSEILRGFWRQYKGHLTNRYYNLSTVSNAPVIVYKGGIALTTGYLFMISYSNLSTTTAYLMIWDEISTGATSLATGRVPEFMFPMWDETGPVAIGTDILTPGGKFFDFGIVWAISSTPTTYTPATTGNIFVEFYFL